MNCFICTGRIGRDAETKFMPDGTPLTTWSMAVDSGWGDKKKTFWLNCALWKREKMTQYLTKGKKVLVRGELSERAYTTQDGREGKSLDLRADDVDPFWESKDQAQPQPRAAQNATGAFPSANTNTDEPPF